MKIYSLSVLHRRDGVVKVLKAVCDVSSYGYFQKSSIQEFMEFTSKIIFERTASYSRASVMEQGYMCHVYVKDSIGSVLIGDNEYPQRVAHTLMTKVLEEFAAVIPPAQWATISESDVNFPQLNEFFKKYQDPKEADAMTKMQCDLNETKIILHGTIQSVLERGEKLDDLVEKSEVLSVQSKSFYKTAKKTNQCCEIL